MVAHGDTADTRPHRLHDPGPFVAAHHRQARAAVTGDEVYVRAAYPGGRHPDEDLALLGRIEFDLLHRELLVYFPHDGCSGAHGGRLLGCTVGKYDYSILTVQVRLDPGTRLTLGEPRSQGAVCLANGVRHGLKPTVAASRA